MKTYVIVTCMLLLLTGGIRAEVSYSRIDAADGSRSRHTSEEAELHQFVHLLEQALQQFDLERQAQLYKAGPAAAGHCALAGSEKSRFCELFS
jgi:hypothetical protein